MVGRRGFVLARELYIRAHESKPGGDKLLNYNGKVTQQYISNLIHLIRRVQLEN